jgi:hypothetical protein
VEIYSSKDVTSAIELRSAVNLVLFPLSLRIVVVLVFVLVSVLIAVLLYILFVLVAELVVVLFTVLFLC